MVYHRCFEHGGGGGGGGGGGAAQNVIKEGAGLSQSMGGA